MPTGPKYHIPEEELRAVAATGTGGNDLARKYGCAPSTIRSQIIALDSTAVRPRDCEIPRGFGGDVVFDAKIGERRFEDDPRIRTSLSTARIYPHTSGYSRSYTGCAASLACA